MSELIFDIAKWQGNPDFAAYKRAGASGVIHKAGGSNVGRYVDSQYRTNAPRIRAAGLALGHYWFNGEGNEVEDADFFVSNLTAYEHGDLLALDIEGERGTVGVPWAPARALRFLSRVLARTGVKAHVYMSSSVTKQPGWDAVAKAGFPLWVAQYGSNNGRPGNLPTIGGWSDWSGWQYTSLYPGIRIDASQFKQSIGSITTVKPATGGSIIGRNVSGYSTTWIQHRLVRAGHAITVDGIYGPATTAAVIAFQKKTKITVDGITGNQTAHALAGVRAAGLAVDGIWGVNTTKALQRALRVVSDGIIGPATTEALQRHLKVKADGIIGPVTRKALQRRVGARRDGIWGRETTTKLQSALNAGTF